MYADFCVCSYQFVACVTTLCATMHHVFFDYQLHILSSAISPCGHNFGWISLLHDSQVDKIIIQVSDIYHVYYKIIFGSHTPPPPPPQHKNTHNTKTKPKCKNKTKNIQR